MTLVSENSSFSIHHSAFLFDPSRCGRCGDLGLWLAPTGRIEVCPRIQCGYTHTEPNAAAAAVARAGKHLAFREITAGPHAFDVARALTRFDADDPCPRQLLIDRYFGWAKSQALRQLHSTIEELRSVWLLPVASRKSLPHGYWICTTQADFEAWVARATASPKTQLTTIFRVARANWPVFGEQLEMNFWNDMTPDTNGSPPFKGGVDAASADGVVVASPE